MIDWFEKVDIKLQVIIISSSTSIIVFVLGWIIRVFYERNSLKFRLKKEFEFEQKKKLKQDIAKNKIPLLNIAEELNYRLWNLNENIDKRWLKISKKEWEEADKYYTRSFVYRFLVFIHWILKTEKDTVSIDTTIADKNDILFLKYIKTFKDIFSEPKLLKELNYSNDTSSHHFFRNNLIGLSKIVVDNEKVLDFDEFKNKTKNKYNELNKVIKYFSEINNDNTDKNLNVLWCFHLIIISFLNKFGHTYQKTDKTKLKELTSIYKDKIKIKKGFENFVLKNKLEKELKYIIRKINNESPTIKHRIRT